MFYHAVSRVILAKRCLLLNKTRKYRERFWEQHVLKREGFQSWRGRKSHEAVIGELRSKSWHTAAAARNTNLLAWIATGKLREAELSAFATELS